MLRHAVDDSRTPSAPFILRSKNTPQSHLVGEDLLLHDLLALHPETVTDKSHIVDQASVTHNPDKFL